MKHWAASLIGKPYEAGAAGPDSFCCIGLVRYYFKERYGLDLPDYQVDKGTPAELRAFVEATAWRRVLSAPSDDDIMTMESLEGRHIGVVVQASDGLGLLHAQGNNQKGSVIWQPLDTLVLYRHKQVWRAPCTA